MDDNVSTMPPPVPLSLERPARQTLGTLLFSDRPGAGPSRASIEAAGVLEGREHPTVSQVRNVGLYGTSQLLGFQLGEYGRREPHALAASHLVGRAHMYAADFHHEAVHGDARGTQVRLVTTCVLVTLAVIRAFP